MNEYQQKRVDDLHILVQDLARGIQVCQAQNKQLNDEVQMNRDLLGKLAAVFDLEYSQDAKRWVKKEKLEELRRKDK